MGTDRPHHPPNSFGDLCLALAAGMEDTLKVGGIPDPPLDSMEVHSVLYYARPAAFKQPDELEVRSTSGQVVLGRGRRALQ